MILRKFLTIMMMFAIASLYASCGFAAQTDQAKQTDRAAQADQAVQKADQKVDNQQNQARALLMKAADFLAQAKQLSVDLNIGFDAVQKTGEKIEFGEVRKVVLARPDFMRVDAEQSDGDKHVVYFDGKELTVYSPDDKMYATASSPGNVDQAIRFLLTDLHLRLPLAMMFVTKLPSDLENRVRSVAIVEKDVTTDVPYTHLAARTDEVDFQVWIPSEGSPLPRRVVITYKKEPGQPQFSANFSNWNLSPKLPEGFFAFNPPQDAKRIQFMAMIEADKPKLEKGDTK